MEQQYHILTLTLIQVFICQATLQKDVTELPAELQLHNNKESIDVSEQIFMKNEPEPFEVKKQNILENVGKYRLKNTTSTIPISQKEIDLKSMQSLPSDSDVLKRFSPLNIDNEKKDSVVMHENFDKSRNTQLSLTRELIPDMEASETEKNTRIVTTPEIIKIPDILNKKAASPFPMINKKSDPKDLLTGRSILKIQKPENTKLRLEKNDGFKNILRSQDDSNISEIKTSLTKFPLPKNILKPGLDSLPSKLVEKISHLQNNSNIIGNLKSHKLGNASQSINPLFEKKELPIKTSLPDILQSSKLLQGESMLKMPIKSKINDTQLASKLTKSIDLERIVRKKDELRDLLAESSSNILKTQLPTKNFSILETKKIAENQMALLNISHVLEKIKNPLKNLAFLKTDAISDMHASGSEIKSIIRKDDSEIIQNNNDEDSARNKNIDISKLPKPSDVMKNIQSSLENKQFTIKSLQPDTSILKQSLLKELNPKIVTERKIGDSTFLTKLTEDTKSDRLTQKLHELKDSLVQSSILKSQTPTLGIKKENQLPLFDVSKIQEKVESLLPENDTTFDMQTSETKVKSEMIQSDDPTAIKDTEDAKHSKINNGADILRLPKPNYAFKNLDSLFEKKQPLIKTLPDSSILKQSLLEELKPKASTERKIDQSTFITKLREDIKSDKLTQKIHELKDSLAQGNSGILNTQLPTKNIPILEIKNNQSTPFNISHIMNKIKSPLLKINTALDMQASESEIKSTIFQNDATMTENKEDEKRVKMNSVADILKLPRSSNTMQKINSLLEKKQIVVRDLQSDITKFPIKNISVSEMKKIAENRLSSLNVSDILEKSKSILKNPSLLKNKASSDMQVSESNKDITNVLTLPKPSDKMKKIQSSPTMRQLQSNTSILKQSPLQDLNIKSPTENETNSPTLLKKPLENTNSHKLTQKINELKDSLAESNSSILKTPLLIKNIPKLESRNSNQLQLLNASDLLKKIKAPLLKSSKSDMEGSESVKYVKQSNDVNENKTNNNEDGKNTPDTLKLTKPSDAIKQIRSSFKTKQISDHLEVLKSQPTLKNLKLKTQLVPINLNNSSFLTKFRESNSSDTMENLKNKLSLYKKIKEEPLPNIGNKKVERVFPTINKNMFSEMQASASELKNKVLKLRNGDNSSIKGIENEKNEKEESEKHSTPSEALQKIGSLLKKNQPIIKSTFPEKLKQSQSSLRKAKSNSLLTNENQIVASTPKSIENSKTDNAMCHKNDTNDLLTSSSNVMEGNKLLKGTSSILNLGKRTNHSVLPNVSDVLKKIKSPSEILSTLKAKPVPDMQTLSSNLKKIIDTNNINEKKEIDPTETLKSSERNNENEKLPSLSKERFAVSKFLPNKSEMLQSLLKQVKLKPQIIPLSHNKTTSETNKPEDLLAQNNIPKPIKVLLPMKNISTPLRKINKENILAKSLNISTILEKVKNPLERLSKLKNISVSDMQASQSEIKDKFKKYRNNDNMTDKIRNNNENQNSSITDTTNVKPFNINNALEKINSLLTKKVSSTERIPLDNLKAPQTLLTQSKLPSRIETETLTKIKQNNDSKSILSTLNSSNLPPLSSLREKMSLLRKQIEPTDLLPLSSIPRSKTQSPLGKTFTNKNSGLKEESQSIPQISTILQRIQSPLKKLSAQKKSDILQSSPSNIKNFYTPSDDEKNENPNFQNKIASFKDSFQSNLQNLKNNKPLAFPSTSNIISTPNKIESTRKLVPNMLKPFSSDLQNTKNNMPFRIPDVSNIINNKKIEKDIRNTVPDLLRNSKSPQTLRKFSHGNPILGSILDNSRLPKSYTNNRKNPLQEIFNKKNVNNNDVIGKMKQNLRDFQSKVPNPFLKQDAKHTMQSLPSILKENKMKQPLLFQPELPLKEKLLSKLSQPSSSSMLKNIFQNDNIKSRRIFPSHEQGFELLKANKKLPMEESSILKGMRSPIFSNIERNQPYKKYLPEKENILTSILKTPQKPFRDEKIIPDNLFSNKNNVLKKNLNQDGILKSTLRGQEDNKILKDFENTVLKAMNSMDKAVRNVSGVFSSGIKKFKILANDVTNKIQHMSNQKIDEQLVKSSPNHNNNNKRQPEDNIVQASNINENYAMCKNLFKSVGDLNYDDVLKNSEDDQEIDDQIISENNEQAVYIDAPRNNLRQNQPNLPLPDFSALDPTSVIGNLDNIERNIERFALFLNVVDRINQYVSNKVNDIAAKVSAFTRPTSIPLI